MDPEKARKHLEFVSGHTGGTAVEILGLLMAAIYIVFIRFECDRLFFRNLAPNSLQFIDFLCIIMQTVLPCTLLSNYILEYHFLLLAIAVIFKLKAPADPPPIPILDGCTAFRRIVRVIVLVFTCVCIYGVDLPIFPRRFAKTEVFGVSLMDVGVGMIVLAIGLSSAAFLDVAQTKSKSKTIKTLLRATVPCFVLGVIRTAVVKSLGYPDHQTEYGIHWNFFFTLALIRVGGFLSTYAFSSLSDFDSMISHFALCIALASVQQFLVLPMTDHVFPHLTHSEISRPSSSGGRLNIWWWIQANAEGIISLPGYLSLYFYGTALGITIRLHLEPPKENGKSEDKLKFLCRQGQEEWFGSPKKVSFAVLCITIPTFLIVAAYGESGVSRRLVNLPYIALQIGLLAPPFALLIYYTFTTPVSSIRGRKDLISLYAKIADHGTMYFLVSNLLTGSLNFLFDSLVFMDVKPMWFSNVCQFMLLLVYTGIGPPLAESLSNLLFKRGQLSLKKLK